MILLWRRGTVRSIDNGVTWRSWQDMHGIYGTRVFDVWRPHCWTIRGVYGPASAPVNLRQPMSMRLRRVAVRFAESPP